MATHSSILAWKIPWIEEPCWLQSMGSQRVGRNWVCAHITNTRMLLDHIYRRENIINDLLQFTLLTNDRNSTGIQKLKLLLLLFHLKYASWTFENSESPWVRKQTGTRDSFVTGGLFVLSPVNLRQKYSCPTKRCLVPGAHKQNVIYNCHLE